MKRSLLIILGVAMIGIFTVALLLINAANERLRAEARATVTRWAEQLHGQTTDAGVYIRHPAQQLPENDPWGTPLNVAYGQGGFIETLTVRSAGPDRAFYTDDDIVAERSLMNLKGIGKGVKDNVEEFAQKGARGLTKGTAEGIKETVQEAFGAKPSRQQKKE